MSLSKAALAEGLQQLFERTPPPGSSAAAGAELAGAYRAYASGAAAGPTAPLAPALASAEGLLGTALGSAFDAARGAGAGGLGVAVAALDAAFVGFWSSPPVAFASAAGAPPFTGVVAIAPPGTLSGLLSAAFAEGAAATATAAGQADALAGALDAWTKTVMVINTPVSPPGPPNPPAPLT